jgi:hypothetical protein
MLRLCLNEAIEISINGMLLISANKKLGFHKGYF